MSVTSVSAIGASSISSFSSSSSDYEEVKKKLKEYGIASTGNEATDKALLQAAEAKEKAASTNSTQSNKESNNNSSSSVPPVPTDLQSILSELGIIAASGEDIDTLISKASTSITEKLSEKDVQEGDKQKYTNLQAQLDQFQSTQSPSAMAGASALSAMNKSILLG